MTNKELMIAEELYMLEDEELMADIDRASKLTNLINATTDDQKEYKNQLCCRLLGSIGENFWIEPPFRIDYGYNTSIGENFFANYDCIILDVAKVTIGDNVLFGPRVSILTAGHPIDAAVRATGIQYGKSIKIGNNVWIGGNSVLNPGVTIGDNTIIGSGSVVTKDIPSNVIAGGNPCKVIREITSEDKKYWETEAAKYWKREKKK